MADRRTSGSTDALGYSERIGEAFNFDAEDLAANRAGRLSDGQELLLTNTVAVQSRGNRRGGWMLGIAIGAAAVAAVVGSAMTTGIQPAALAVAGGILAWITLIGLFFQRRGRRLTEAFKERTVRTVEGVLTTEPTMSTGTSLWKLTIGDVSFGTDGSAVGALVDGARYRLHYLQGPADVLPLSIERAD